jgi:hypothetical protein
MKYMLIDIYVPYKHLMGKLVSKLFSGLQTSLASTLVHKRPPGTYTLLLLARVWQHAEAVGYPIRPFKKAWVAIVQQSSSYLLQLGTMCTVTPFLHDL